LHEISAGIKKILAKMTRIEIKGRDSNFKEKIEKTA